MTDERETALQTLSMELALLLPGDSGFLPADQCIQGHSLSANGCGVRVGDSCHECVHNKAERLHPMPKSATKADETRPVFEAQDRECDRIRRAMEQDPNLHPEWRVPRGGPRPFAQSMEAIADAERMFLHVHPNARLQVTVDGDGCQAAWNPSHSHLGYYDHGQGPTEPEARCSALAGAIRRWGMNPAQS